MHDDHRNEEERLQIHVSGNPFSTSDIVIATERESQVVKITGIERLRLYESTLFMVGYTVTILTLSVVAITFAALENPPSLWVLILEGCLVGIVAIEACIRLCLVGYLPFCKHKLFWLDITLCFTCVVLYLFVMGLLYWFDWTTNDDSTIEEYETTGSLIGIATRSVVHVMRVSILIKRKLNSKSMSLISLPEVLTPTSVSSKHLSGVDSVRGYGTPGQTF